MQHTVIVGGSSGIGLATAKALSGKVTITGRREARLAAAMQHAPALHTAVMDATAPSFDAIGPFDHLVLALGSGRGIGPFKTVSIADIKLGFEEKVFAHMATAQAALPFMSARGSITFVSAVSAHAAAPGTAGIGAANAAIASLIPTLAVELKPLRVNGVSPGVIDTPWWDAFPADQRQAAFAEYGAKTPVGRVGTADDVARAIAFLIDDTFMTGHMLIVDGGLRYTA